jgi:hypothetical protein
MKNFLGRDFVWFVGQVEDILDPEQIGRVRVRVFGIHSSDKTSVPTDDLPWCQVIMQATSGFNSTSGRSSVGLQVNSQVIGFFLDGENLQHPIVLGSFMGLDASIMQQLSSSAAQTRNSSPETNSLFTVPVAYSPKYPHNSIEVTESGHVFEVDNTPGSERILKQHKSGTFEEIQPDGSKVTRVVSKNYEVVLSDNNIHVKGNSNTVIDGNKNDVIKGKITISVTGDVNLNIQGNVNQTVSGTTSISSTLALIIKSIGIVSIKGALVKIQGTTQSQVWT